MMYDVYKIYLLYSKNKQYTTSFQDEKAIFPTLHLLTLFRQETLHNQNILHRVDQISLMNETTILD